MNTYVPTDGTIEMLANDKMKHIPAHRSNAGNGLAHADIHVRAALIEFGTLIRNMANDRLNAEAQQRRPETEGSSREIAERITAQQAHQSLHQIISHVDIDGNSAIVMHYERLHDFLLQQGRAALSAKPAAHAGTDKENLNVS